MLASWCFQCGLDYAPEVVECLECGVPTVGHAPGSPDIADDAGELVAYELHAWNGPARAAVERSLHRMGIAHRWSGPTLLIGPEDEEGVDEVFETVDREMETSLVRESITDGEASMIGFDMRADAELKAEIRARLNEAAISSELGETGLLMVSATDEDAAAEIIEATQRAMRQTETFGPGVEGVEALDVVQTMFDVSNVLRRNTRDMRARRALIEIEELARSLKLPFGYEAASWRAVLNQVAYLANEIDDDNDEGIEEEAKALHNHVRSLV